MEFTTLPGSTYTSIQQLKEDSLQFYAPVMKYTTDEFSKTKLAKSIKVFLDSVEKEETKPVNSYYICVVLSDSKPGSETLGFNCYHAMFKYDSEEDKIIGFDLIYKAFIIDEETGECHTHKGFLRPAMGKCFEMLPVTTVDAIPHFLIHGLKDLSKEFTVCYNSCFLKTE